MHPMLDRNLPLNLVDRMLGSIDKSIRASLPI
jgi:hypothetical protein